jgi:hypothetical protein
MCFDHNFGHHQALNEQISGNQTINQPVTTTNYELLFKQ